MIRFYTTCFCFFVFFAASAQSNIATLSSLNFSPTSQIKASIHLNNNSVIKGIITQITDSIVVLSQSSQKGNSIVYTSSNIPVQEIKMIKIKKHAFITGMASGAVIAGSAGYATGSDSYYNNRLTSDDETKADLKGDEYALIYAVPGAVAGGIIGSAVIKKRYVINGDINNIKVMMKTLWNFNE